MSNPYAAPQSASPSPQSPMPFRARHAVLAVAALACAHAYNHWLLTKIYAESNVLMPPRSISEPLGLVSSACIAAGVVGFVALFETRIQFNTLLRQPGHWALCITMTSLLLERSTAWFIVTSVLQNVSFPVLEFVQWLWYVPILLAAVAAWKHEGLWRVAFGTVVGLTLITTIAARTVPSFGTSAFLSVTSTIAESSVIAVAIYREQTGDVKRDWVHWIGVAIYFVHATSILAGQLFAARLTY